MESEHIFLGSSMVASQILETENSLVYEENMLYLVAWDNEPGTYHAAFQNPGEGAIVSGFNYRFFTFL